MKTSATWLKHRQHCFHFVLLKADSRRTSLIINPANPKTFLSAFKALNKGKSTISTFSNGSATACTDSDKAEMLGNYFSTCFNHIKPLLSSTHCPPDCPFLDDFLCTEEEIHLYLSNLDISRATGSDGISARMLNLLLVV